MIREIYVIWLRELKKFLAERTNLLAEFIWPIVIIFVLGIGIDSFVNIKEIGVTYTSFLGPGILTLIASGWGMGSGVDIIEDRKRFIKRLLVAPINRFSIIIGKILGSITVQVFVFLAILTALVVYNRHGVANIPLTLLMLILISFGFTGLGLLLASAFRSAKSYEKIANFVISALYFLSGAFFPTTSLPPVMKYLAYVNPLTYGVDFVRWSVTGLNEISLLVDMTVVLAFSAAVILLGGYTLDKYLRK